MRSIDKAGELLVLCGLSGSGKSTLARHALAKLNGHLQYLNTYTTRQKRLNEDDLEYTFVTDDEYDRAKGEASIWDESIIYNNRYGVDASQYIARMDQGESFIVCSVPDHNVVMSMRSIYSYDRVKTIYLPIDTDVSAERMRDRDSAINFGRVAMDSILWSERFDADYIFNPSESQDSDKRAFIELVKGIMS